MNNNELEQQRIASIGAISISEDLISKLSENERVIFETKAASNTMSNMSANISDVIHRAINEMNTDSVEKSTAT